VHTLTFFPLGNADCCRIKLSNGDRILFDYAHMRDESDKSEKRWDLASDIRDDLKKDKRNSFRVVAFTHLDDDHIHRSSEIFYLEHAEKYQSADRIKIEELWVPAAAIVEDGLTGEARILRSEARHRFLAGKGIRVFSRPEVLEEWLEENGLSLADRRDLITDAGRVVPGISLEDDGVEFFVHSPFAHRLDSGELLDRNSDCLFMQALFEVDGIQTKLLLGSDVDHDAIGEIVQITKKHANEARLEWDIFKLPHHCSYLSIGPERGDEATEPTDQTQWLYVDQGLKAAIMISTSKPIPVKGSEDDNCDQPPHRQAARFHKTHTLNREGEFKVTMEHPSCGSPKPIEIELGARKATIKKSALGGAAAVISSAAPRAG
jgi:hypothetical protein